jgi:hypothetical protein
VRELDQEDWPESPNLLRVDSEEEDTPQTPPDEEPRSPSLLAEWYSQVDRYRTVPYRTGTVPVPIDVGRVANCDFLFGQLGTMQYCSTVVLPMVQS